MYAHERHRKITEILHFSSFQSVEQLAGLLNVSVATVRRDLAQLADRNEVIRVHGGAVCLHYGLNRPAAGARNLEESEDAAQLAKAALQTIRDGETIALDSGPTVLELAKLLPQRTNLTILASSTVAAWTLREARHLRVLCLGGEMFRANRVNRGSFALQMLGQMYFDKTFVEVAGIDPEKGLTIDDPAEAGIKQALMKQSKEVFLMATPMRIGHVAPVKLGDVFEVQRVFAHAGATTAPVLGAIQKQGVAITFV
jgi:DeoR family transcriptional regulator, fructose operon transcriptional repressor